MNKHWNCCDYAEDLNSLDSQLCICLNAGLDPTQSVGKILIVFTTPLDSAP